MLLGSHVGMSGKEMMLGSVREAISYRADTFMLYTGAPQNTRRKDVSELRIPEAQALMKEAGIEKFVVHAPYIINLGNSVNQDTYELAVSFLRTELSRTEALGSRTLVLHPGSHVGAGEDAGIAAVIQGLNETLTPDTKVRIALETMAGKGSELGRNFEQMARIFDGVKWNDKLRICLDTCHLHDAGYDVKNDFPGVLKEFEKYFPLSVIACIHLNDSMNGLSSSKDRHSNLGFGEIGFDSLCAITRMSEFADTPIILETPYRSIHGSADKLAPYELEIEMLRNGKFNPNVFD